jgi:hypothetical protein
VIDPAKVIKPIISGGVVDIHEHPKVWVGIESGYYSKGGNLKVSGGASVSIKNKKSSTIVKEFRRLAKIFKEEVSEELLSLIEED